MVTVSIALAAAVVVMATTSSPGWADPSIAFATATPTHIMVGQRAQVTVAAKIDDVQSALVNSLRANLFRVHPDGALTKLVQLKDDGSKGDPTAGDGIYTGIQNFNDVTSATIHLKVVAVYVPTSDTTVTRTIESHIFTVAVGGLLPAGQGATIPGEGGTSITVPPNAIPYAAFLSIAATATTAIVAPVSANLPLVAAVTIEIDGPGFGSELRELTSPLQISVPAPSGTPEGGRFIVAKQVVFERPAIQADDNGTPEFVVIPASAQLVPIALATVSAGAIVTQPGTFAGIKSSGTYAIVGAPGSGFVTGAVTESTVAQGGVVVSNSTNSLVALTDTAGSYSLFISGNVAFDVIAFHPLRGSAGVATGTIAVGGATVTVNIPLTPLSPTLNMRRGIRNGGFERRGLASGDCIDHGLNGQAANEAGLRGWEFAGSGAIEVVRQFGPTAPIVAGDRPGSGGNVFVPAHQGGVTIVPTEGDCMAAIATGTPGGDEGVLGASLSQSFQVPIGASTLRIDYNYVSEELPEWQGSQFQDPFRIRVIPSQGTPIEVALVRVDDVAPTAELIGDCGFPDGDDTCARSGWTTVQANLTAFAGTNVTVQLLFDVVDFGDSIFTTKVFLDNIRFSTVWLDVKVIDDATLARVAPVTARVRRDVRQANEVLSQAGVNLRIRNVQTVVNADLLAITQKQPHDLPPAPNNICAELLGADGLPLANYQLEPEEITLMNTNRSGTAQDVNVYYVATTNAAANGWTANPGDFCRQVSIVDNVNWGTMVVDSAHTRTLTHELGHALIRATTGSSLMHTCSGGGDTCFTVPNALETAIVTPLQSEKLNALSPLLKP